MKPICIELFAGLHGWGEGFVAEGFEVIGFDIVDMVRDLGLPRPHPDIHLVIQDVLTLHGSQFRNAAVIVASPPCQRYSYMAMPFSRGKAQAAAIRADASGAMLADLNALFNACFRIQREACEAAGRHIPMVVENVRGAQLWVGRAAWSFGSFYLWGDIPALMPRDLKTKGATGLWFYAAETRGDPREASKYSLRSEAIKQHGSGAAWFDTGLTKFPSRSERRKAASAQIAKIPFALSNHIARIYKPCDEYQSFQDKNSAA